ncbi:hypothetical protein NDU88_002094 [Pleurodeles waltl]|uniref:Uncharacterized protein n=1 Tax=Pleurodeles waltl TaxID=8319 RepID=A0AAV7NHL3_PLEWA|nr:hypothetical protein NDU88_002094 [Pleurodeles waltl]
MATADLCLGTRSNHPWAVRPPSRLLCPGTPTSVRRSVTAAHCLCLSLLQPGLSAPRPPPDDLCLVSVAGHAVPGRPLTDHSLSTTSPPGVGQPASGCVTSAGSACTRPRSLNGASGSSQIQRAPASSGGRSHQSPGSVQPPGTSLPVRCGPAVRPARAVKLLHTADRQPAPAQPTASPPVIRWVLLVCLGEQAPEDAGAQLHHAPQASSVPQHAPGLQHWSQTAAGGRLLCRGTRPGSWMGPVALPPPWDAATNTVHRPRRPAASPQGLRISQRAQRHTASTGSTRLSPASGSATPRSRPQAPTLPQWTPIHAGAK